MGNTCPMMMSLALIVAETMFQSKRETVVWCLYGAKFGSQNDAIITMLMIEQRYVERMLTGHGNSGTEPEGTYEQD